MCALAQTERFQLGWAFGFDIRVNVTYVKLFILYYCEISKGKLSRYYFEVKKKGERTFQFSVVHFYPFELN